MSGNDPCCTRCGHPLTDHGRNTGICTWREGSTACKCLGPDQARQVESWPKARRAMS